MEKALNDNVIVVGTSGTGKTYSFVEPNILQGNTNYVVADAKGDILRDTGASLKKMGYKIQVLNLVDLQHSNTYNPLAYLNDPLDYLQFADQVITSDVTGFHSAKDSRQDPFWDTAAETLLQALIYFVKEFLPEDQQNMGNVNRLFNLLDTPAESIGDALTILKQSKLDFEYRFDPRKAPSSLYDQEYITIGDLLFEWALQENPASQAVKMWHSIVGILGVNLTRYALADVENLTSGNEIDFNSLLQPKTALFILYDDFDVLFKD
ncbi:hypothetical protein LAC30SC_09425 [Lactobacillus amylovorus]|uniref:Conjugal transfer protein n=1 Tax=Lactobacillus amylovorus TaxID=1604 RepID=F0TGZ0_LACAM|nr:type IV secretory system conjugative DNA transfer family protein [Lactobacillus amylovorus]ADZ07984.1 hypothetical protein LAC30SC_09425 [Lactobacillus amylovorus]MDB6250764.1 type IV secretory system conjugative DNA transfer family protein [Lactobacillus amylovorus]